MALKTRPFDVAEHLKTDEDICDFLAAVIEEGDESDYIHALNTAARAKGMTEIAKKAGLTRASLYKSLAEGGNPRFETISKVSKALGVRLVARPLRGEG
ncbi:MAG: addiction module antidote protein [Desulfoprunum sp.]|jgi:probable addiction module antidote protein|uniref:addiction module antidote protein n=1 Tax=Desulfoprunum sp. TaxID=2020866 RepID=UPI00052CA0EA|nr:addiction module antitoxin [Desulfobulbus sp. Tol-SR]